jgi:hypothetical protein
MQFVEATQKSTNLLKGTGPFWGTVRFPELDATTEELIKFNRAMDQLVAYILEEHRGMISRDAIDDITKMITVCGKELQSLEDVRIQLSKKSGWLRAGLRLQEIWKTLTR